MYEFLCFVIRKRFWRMLWGPTDFVHW